MNKTITSRPRTPVLVGGALAMTVLLAACGASADNTASSTRSSSSTYPVVVEDCSGKVTFDEAPQEVLTIGTAAISLLDAAGASDRIAARSGEFGAPLPKNLTTPPDAAKILDPSDPAAEAIIGAGADVVYGYGLFNAKPEMIEQAGIPVLTAQGECGHDANGKTRPITFSTVTDDIRRLGTVFGTAEVADKNAAAVDADVKTLTSKASTEDQSAAWLYYFSSSDSLSAYASSSMAHAILSAANLTDVFGDEETSYLDITMEGLLKEDPDWLVLAYGLYGESEADARAKLMSEPGVKDLTAVKNGQVVLVPGTSSETSQQALDGLEKIVAATSDAS